MFSSFFGVLTPLITTGSIASAGLMIMPMRRLQLKRQMNKGMDDTREALEKVLKDFVERDIHNFNMELETSILPYKNYVDRQEKLIESTREDFHKSIKANTQLKEDISRLLK